MKTINQLLLTTAVLLFCITASAHDFEVDGIYYNITSETDLTVSVTFKGDKSDSYNNEYSGSIVIPSRVIYDRKYYCVTSIGELAFNYCTYLTNITIPNSITSIGFMAFSDCSSLTNITIPNSINNIGEGAFQRCHEFTSITIPNNVTIIKRNTFYGCI